MDIYIEYFFVTLFFSSVFALGGVGSATALVPIFNMLGLPFGMSKALGLFVNTSTTITASLMNLKRKVLDVKFTFPLIVSSMLFAPVGAYLSKYTNEHTMKWMLVAFLVFSASMMLFGKKEAKTTYTKKWILYVIGISVGTFSGLIGVGGGGLFLPILIMLGYDAKKTAIAVSFILPFSTFSAFLMYANTIHINWALLIDTAIAALLGGYIGNRIMHFRLDSKQIKKIIAILLYLIAFKLSYGLIK